MLAPLRDVIVVDLTRVLSGPFCTQQLVDLGAEVIKVERPESGDDTRRFGPPFVAGESTYFLSVNRGKKSLAVDLKSPEGLALVRRLIGQADVVVENFRPGTASRLGLDLGQLRKDHPRLITCAISGYGASGDPDFSQRAGYDAVIQAVSGFMAITGEPDGPPTKVGVAVSDMIAGMFAAQAILAALLERTSSGEGAHIDLSMQDAVIALLTYQAGIWLSTGQPPRRMGNAHPSICPYESVQTQDGLYALAVGNDAQFRRFSELLGRPELADEPRFATNRARVENREALLEEILPPLARRTRAEWDELFRAQGIPGAPVLEVDQALEHPQVAARKSILEHDHPLAGRIRTIATPMRFDGQAPTSISAPPVLGADTQTLLQTRLGLSHRDVDDLIARGVVAVSAPAS